MHKNTAKRVKWSARVWALILTVALVGTFSITQLGNTFAASGDINVKLECESGIPVGYRTIEAGQSGSVQVYNMNEAVSAAPDIATVEYQPGSFGSLVVTGQKAGVVGIAYGTSFGVVENRNYQITDSNNISAYTIKDGGEVYFTGLGKMKAAPVSVTEGLISRIAWTSMNNAVAMVDGNGNITSKGIGAAIIQGSFVDKWGVPRDLHLLVGVGVKLSDSDLGHLIDLIHQGEGILDDNPGQYSTDSLHDLEDAVNNGKGVIDSKEPGDQAIKDAITDLEDAINGMDVKPNRPDDVIGPDKDGNYYHPVGDPENVYEVVDNNGNSMEPPEYIYNPGGDPVGKPGDNRPAYPHDGSYYVEDPKGSNIYKPINGSGAIKDRPAIWGGPDGMFGGGDDESVKKFGNDYWLHIGQNIWQKVDKNKPTQLDPTLVGGGPDNNPATDPVTPIYKHDDKYYVGPLPPGTSDGYYYGDKLSGGDGKVNSSQDAMHSTDEKFYLVNGQMVTESHLPGIPGLENANNGSTVTIDGTEWIKIKTDSSGKYAMLLMNDVIGPNQYDRNAGYTSEYNGADIRIVVDQWYSGLDAPVLKKFAHPAMIGSDNYMTWPYAGTGQGYGIYAFIPKKSDISDLPAVKLDMGVVYWTATKTKSGDFVGYQETVAEGGGWSLKGVTQMMYIRPAIWVKI